MARCELIVCDRCGHSRPAGIGDSPLGWIRVSPVVKGDTTILESNQPRDFCCLECAVRHLDKMTGVSNVQLPLEQDAVLHLILNKTSLMPPSPNLVDLDKALSRLTASWVYDAHEDQRCALICIAALAINWLRQIL